MRLMLAGEPGTGKKLAARILAAEHGLAFVSVELGTVMTHDRAETERRLDQLFTAAHRSHAIVYLADAGTWFVKRAPGWTSEEPDASVSALLRRIDAYPGVVVFAATLFIASAAVRERLDLVIDLPFPRDDARMSIWRLLLPAAARLHDRELDFLAASFRLSGGEIQRCCVAAASAAARETEAIQMRHVIAAIEHECPGRLQNVEARRALERFHAGTWADASVARQPVGVAASSFGETRVRSERDGRRRSPSGRVLTVLALGLVVAAAVVGFVLARAPGTPGHTAPAHGTRAAAGLLSVALPSGWRQQRLPRNLGLDLTDAVALAPSASAGGVLVIGRTGTSSSTLLPQRLLSALPNAPTTQIVTLGGARFYRYLHLSPSGASGRESVYALPTTVGTVLGVCVEPRASLRFASDCEHVVGTIKLASGSVLAVGPSASYASALNAAITRLNATRSIGASRLRGARTPPEQASAARALAASYYVAASSVGQLSAGVAQPADLDVAAALRSTGDAYAALGRAAARNDAHAYAAARGSVANATSALNVAFARLAKFGYTIA